MARIYMRDHLTLDLRTADKKLIQCDAETGSNSLLVRVAATHAGIVNGNYRFYRPDMMMKGTSSWTDSGDYPRPVLAHHNEDSDPLGRVLNAKYMDLSYLYKDEFPILNDSVFYCSDAKKRMSTIETVDWVVENLTDIPGYRGLGVIELGLKITKPDAIEKVNRKEFLTVSVGFSTDSAICSICHQDWAVDDRCEHELGKSYKDKTCYVTSGAMDFNEVSYVNNPADPFATTISVENLTDSVNRNFFLGLPLKDQIKRAQSAGIVLTDALYSSDIEMLGDQNMKLDLKAIADELRATITQERALAIRHDLSDFKGETDAEKKDSKKLLSSVRAKIKANGWSATAPVSDTTSEATILDLIPQEEKDRAAAELAASEVRDTAAAATETASSTVTTETTVVSAETITLSDSLKKIFENENCKDANEGIKKVVLDLESAYAAIDTAQSKRYFRYAICALSSSWYDREEFESYLSSVVADTDMVALPKAEHEELMTAVDTFDASEAELIKQRDAEESSKIRIMKKCKDTLATLVVMNKVLTGAKGFTDLKPEQITDAIVKRSARDLSSLEDLKDEILEELQWAKPLAAPTPAVVPGIEISDSAELPGDKIPVSQTDSVIEEPEVPVLAVREVPMTRRERMEAEARSRYLAASA